METISGKSLQTFRIRVGLKAKDVAARVGLSPSYYSEIERGKKPLPSEPKFIRALGNALGISDYILNASVVLSESNGTPMSGQEKDRARKFIDQKGPEFFLPLLLSRIGTVDPLPASLMASEGLVSASEEVTAISRQVIDDDLPKLNRKLEQQYADEESRLLSETDAKFEKRLMDFNRLSRHYFDDSAEVFKLAGRVEKSGDGADLLILRSIAKTLGSLQPMIESGFQQLLEDNRTLRRIVRSKPRT